MIQNQSNQALIDNTIGQNGGSPKPAAHLNVYKPTFIINNSFQNEQALQDEMGGGGRPSASELNKKYAR